MSPLEFDHHASPRRRVEFTAASDATPLVDPHWAELAALTRRAEANRAAMSRLQAERAEICAAALDLVARRVAQRDAAHPGRQVGDTIPLREVMAELAAALRVGERTISNWLGDGAALVSTYRATLDALRDGRIDERHASAIIDGGAALSEDNRTEYEQLIVPIAENETAPATRQLARAIAAKLQPDSVDESHRRALAERCVRVFDLDDGLSRLLLDGPTAIVRGIFERLTAMGIEQADVDAAAGDAGAGANVSGAGVSGADATGTDATDARATTSTTPAERTLDQRRADIMCDLLLTSTPGVGADAGLGALRATVQVTIPILTLAGLDDEPALLDGESPIDAATARALAAAAPQWQRVMIHPVTREPVRLDTYRPSKRLRRLLGARDAHCRWPGCRRDVRRCDLDHTIPFEQGGTTCAGNLAALCKRHHTLKHASPWRVRQCGGGGLEFTSPTGRTYRTDAPPVVVGAAGAPAWARYLGIPTDAADPPAF